MSMVILYNILKYLYSALTYAASKVLSTWGLIGTAVAGVSTFLAAIFSKFTFFSKAQELLSTAQSVVSDVFASIDTSMPILRFLFYSCALDYLCKCLIWSILLSVGVTGVIFVTLFLGFMALLPPILIVRYALRSIRFATLGRAG